MSLAAGDASRSSPLGSPDRSWKASALPSILADIGAPNVDQGCFDLSYSHARPCQRNANNTKPMTAWECTSDRSASVTGKPSCSPTFVIWWIEKSATPRAQKRARRIRSNSRFVAKAMMINATSPTGLVMMAAIPPRKMGRFISGSRVTKC